MNLTKIEWTDFTWNPVTGCWGPGGTAEKPNRCAYCYAARIAHRMAHVEGSGYGQGMDFPDPRQAFDPRFHSDRLDQPAKVKKPAKIFVCSMADLFGDWVPDEWIHPVLTATEDCNHTFQFLTKNHRRMKDFNPWPPNCWVGATVTNQPDADKQLSWLLQVDAPVLFVSHEPLLGQIYLPRWIAGKWTLAGHDHPTEPCKGLNWAIIGAMTGPGAVKPESAWVQGLIDQYRAAGVPIFLKDNLNWPEKIQEWPHEMSVLPEKIC